MACERVTDLPEGECRYGGRVMNLKALKQGLKYPHKGSALRYFMQSPLLALAIHQDPSPFYFSKTIESMLGANIVSCLHSFLPERFLGHLREKALRDYDGVRLIIYLLVRNYKPEIVVETGVAHGMSTAFILCAMHENSKGHLYSIDLPPYDISAKIEINDKGSLHTLEDGQRHWVDDKYPVGDLVPEYLRERWTLVLGDAKKELPNLLNKTKEVSIFFHDSLHTYQHMMFEYDTAWPHITKGGLLLSHDILWNSAFLEFSKKVDSKPLIYRSLGVIKKK